MDQAKRTQTIQATRDALQTAVKNLQHCIEFAANLPSDDLAQLHETADCYRYGSEELKAAVDATRQPTNKVA